MHEAGEGKQGGHFHIARGGRKKKEGLADNVGEDSPSYLQKERTVAKEGGKTV